MPDLMQTQPADSHSKWSKDGARLKATQDSAFEWREVGAQVIAATKFFYESPISARLPPLSLPK
jgi:hypothetical protein